MNDEAVSNVLGGVLFVVVMFIFYAMVRTSFVPVWEEEREEAFVNRVEAQLAQLQGELDRQASNLTLSAVTVGISVAEPPSSRWFSGARVPGTLSFHAGTSASVVSANELLQYVADGASVGGVDESWTPLVGPSILDDVTAVKHLRLRVVDPTSQGDGDYTQVALTDADGDFAGSLRVYIDSFGSQRGIFTRVTAPDGTIVHDGGMSVHHQANLAYAWVDGLDPEYLFDDMILGAKKPMTMTFSEQGLDGEFTVTYRQQVGTGGIIVGNNGLLITDFVRSFGGGRLEVEIPNQHYPETTYIMENGAVLVQQGDRVAMKFDPNIFIQKANSVTIVRTTVPSLVGQGATASQMGIVPLTVQGALASHFEGTVPRWTHTVTTEHVAVWQDFFRRAASEGGLDEATGEFVIGGTANSASITVYGATTAPTSTLHDIAVTANLGQVTLSVPT